MNETHTKKEEKIKEHHEIHIFIEEETYNKFKKICARKKTNPPKKLSDYITHLVSIHEKYSAES